MGEILNLLQEIRRLNGCPLSHLTPLLSLLDYQYKTEIPVAIIEQVAERLAGEAATTCPAVELLSRAAGRGEKERVVCSVIPLDMLPCTANWPQATIGLCHESSVSPLAALAGIIHGFNGPENVVVAEIRVARGEDSASSVILLPRQGEAVVGLAGCYANRIRSLAVIVVSKWVRAVYHTPLPSSIDIPYAYIAPGARLAACSSIHSSLKGKQLLLPIELELMISGKTIAIFKAFAHRHNTRVEHSGNKAVYRIGGYKIDIGIETL